MAQPRIPFRRLATLTTLAALPPTIVLGALALMSRLDWHVAVGSVAISILMLGWMVRRGLVDVYRILEFSETLARDGEGGPASPGYERAVPRVHRSGNPASTGLGA